MNYLVCPVWTDLIYAEITGKHYTKRIADHTPDLARMEYASLQACPHEHLCRAGYHEWNNKQRWRCAICNKRFTEGGRDDSLIRIRVLVKLFKQGMTMREAGKVSGYSKNTVCKYFKMFRKHETILCGCGLELWHKGDCAGRHQMRDRDGRFMRAPQFRTAGA